MSSKRIDRRYLSDLSGNVSYVSIDADSAAVNDDESDDDGSGEDSAINLESLPPSPFSQTRDTTIRLGGETKPAPEIY